MDKDHKVRRYSSSSSTASDIEDCGRVRRWSERQTSYSLSTSGSPRTYEDIKHEVGASSIGDKSFPSSSREIGRSASFKVNTHSNSPRERHAYSSKERSAYSSREKDSYCMQRGSYSSKERVYYSPKERGSYSSKNRGSYSPKERGSYSSKNRGSYSPKERGSYSSKNRGSYSPKERVSCASKDRGSCASKERVSCTSKDRGSCASKERVSCTSKDRGSCASKERVSCTSSGRGSYSPKGGVSCASRDRGSYSYRQNRLYSSSDRDSPIRHNKEKKCRKSSLSLERDRKISSFKCNRLSSSPDHRISQRKYNKKNIQIKSSSRFSFGGDSPAAVRHRDEKTKNKRCSSITSYNDGTENIDRNRMERKTSSSSIKQSQNKDYQTIRSERSFSSAKDKNGKQPSSLSDRDSPKKEMQIQDNVPSSFIERSSFSFSDRDSQRKRKRQPRGKQCSSFSGHQEYSVSPSDNVHSLSSRNSESPIKDYNTSRDKRYSFLSLNRDRTRDSTVVKEIECCFSASIEDTPVKYSMKIQRRVKRKRSSRSSSTDSITATNETEDGLSSKRRVATHKRYCRRSSKSPTAGQFDNKIQNLATVRLTSIQNIHDDRQPNASKSQTIFKASIGEPHRSTKDIFQQQNFSTCCSGHDSRHVELSSGRRRFEGRQLKQSPVMYGRTESFRPVSDRSSPNFFTPVSQHKGRWQGSPQFTSPSFMSSPSPQSALRGLDQPRPWARDLVSRSVNLPSFIDSHCHIDLLYDRLGVSHSTKFCEFRKMVNCSFPANFHGCVAVFCYPKTYDPRNPQNELFYTLAEDENIWFALGCHPKSATDFVARHENGLRKALSHPKVVALGEIGLDYSGSFYHHAETQKAVLRKQIQMALDMKLPLVIHCRDAYDDCLAILIEMVPRLWRIHLHCFCGNMEIAKIWLETFPNLYIGLTPVITYMSAHDSMDAARNIPLERILLETDSPYFVPGNIREGPVQVSHPGFALFTAERIAELRNIPVNTVLQMCRTNTRLMYGI